MTDGGIIRALGREVSIWCHLPLSWLTHRPSIPQPASRCDIPSHSHPPPSVCSASRHTKPSAVTYHTAPHVFVPSRPAPNRAKPRQTALLRDIPHRAKPRYSATYHTVPNRAKPQLTAPYCTPRSDPHHTVPHAPLRLAPIHTIPFPSARGSQRTAAHRTASRTYHPASRRITLSRSVLCRLVLGCTSGLNRCAR